MRLVSKLHRAVFARPAFHKFNSRLLYLALHGLGVLNYQNDDISGESYLLRTWLPKALEGRKNPVFFDVGANIGHYSAMLSAQFPTSFIHAFEPHPKNYSRLVGNGFPVQRVKCHNVALGESKGSLILYDHAASDGSEHASLYEATITEFHDRSAVATSVPIETLDEMAAKEGVAYIDFLKIDTEGHELAVLMGASKLLRENRIGIVQFEFNALHVFSRAFFRDFRILLHGYSLYRLLPKGLLPLNSDITSTEIFAFQNVLAVPKHAD